MLSSWGSLNAGIAPESVYSKFESFVSPLSVDGYLRQPYIGGVARRVLLAMAMPILQTSHHSSGARNCALRKRAQSIELSVRLTGSDSVLLKSWDCFPGHPSFLKFTPHKKILTLPMDLATVSRDCETDCVS